MTHFSGRLLGKWPDANEWHGRNCRDTSRQSSHRDNGQDSQLNSHQALIVYSFVVSK